LQNRYRRPAYENFRKSSKQVSNLKAAENASNRPMLPCGIAKRRLCIDCATGFPV
jgi:hypothetical protein